MGNDENTLDLGFEPKEPGTLPWFPFWSNRWMGSDTTAKMSLVHQAIMLRMMCNIHTYGSLSRDPWVLKGKLDVKYDTLVAWMKTNASEGEVIHEEGCNFTGDQSLISRSEVTPNSELGRTHGGLTTESARTHGGLTTECSCKRWTLPKFVKLQTLTKKSSADSPSIPAGKERKGDKSTLYISSAARASKQGKVKTSSPVSGKNLSDEQFNALPLEKQMHLSDSQCTVCSGDGTYSKKQEGTWMSRQTRCDCSRR